MTKKSPTNIAKRNYGFIKGRLAEGIAERLFYSLKMDVYPTGLEIKNPHIARLQAQGKIKTKPIEKFEYGPDFLICQHHKSNDTYSLFEVEIKFRAHSKIQTSELKKYKDPEIVFLFLDNKNFYCIKNSELQSKYKTDINFTTLYFSECSTLQNCKYFQFSEEEKNIIYAFTFLIKASLNQFENKKGLNTLFEKYYKNIKKKFNFKTKEKL